MSYLQFPVPPWFLFKAAHLYFSVKFLCLGLARFRISSYFWSSFCSAAVAPARVCFIPPCLLNWRRFLIRAPFSPPDAVSGRRSSRILCNLRCSDRGLDIYTLCAVSIFAFTPRFLPSAPSFLRFFPVFCHAPLLPVVAPWLPSQYGLRCWLLCRVARRQICGWRCRKIHAAAIRRR